MNNSMPAKGTLLLVLAVLTVSSVMCARSQRKLLIEVPNISFVGGGTSSEHKDNYQSSSHPDDFGSGVIGGTAASALRYGNLAQTSFTKTGTFVIQGASTQNTGKSIAGSGASTISTGSGSFSKKCP